MENAAVPFMATGARSPPPSRSSLTGASHQSEPKLHASSNHRLTPELRHCSSCHPYPRCSALPEGTKVAGGEDAVKG
nr:hypothetical protein Iba_chr04aCG15770 [Ipomoea batatas]GMC82530.1 hypothetical protein Iba_chr04bCG14240 [Ipomoea batatas]